jgi:lysine 6-dehydrogenase
MPNIIVLGAGMVGSVIAADLAREGHAVTLADIRKDALDAAASRSPRPITTAPADLSDPAVISSLVKPFDLVMGALPSRLGFDALRAVITAGKPAVDISFMSEDFAQLDHLAKGHAVTVITDCGVAPGMSHILAAHAASLLDSCDAIEILVGGLPRIRSRPFEYKAAFSPADVIEEYLRPARIVEHSRIVVRPALSEPRLLDFVGVGTLEAFNTDGLRSLTTSLRVPNMKEQTLRYPGHIDLMRAFRDTGLFSSDPLPINGQPVRPIDLTSRLLFPKWTYQPGEEDLTVMRVSAEGRKNTQPARVQFDLLDFYHQPSAASSMARTTAFPATIAASLILSKKFHAPGVNPPERLAANPDTVNFILAQHARRGVSYTRSA